MIDTHCHLYDPRFDEDIEETLGRARQAGVTGMLIAACDRETADRAERLAEAEALSLALGLHPHEASRSVEDKGWLEDIRARLLRCPAAAAVGEMGLDYHYTFSPPDVQRQVFRAQLELAKELGLPVTIHSRAAEEEVLDILEEAGPPPAGAVLHAFTGSEAAAKRALEMGLYIGVTGMITFRNAEDLRRIIATVPLERILLETDSPYLAPVPHRGKRNEPAFLIHVRDALADLLGVSAAEVQRITTENARRVFTRLRETI
ncbi:MAG: hydrolase TatD [Armatimonadota bacterium]|nr:MAG: hydrolase TatD [Armatimonadota bacterium]